MPFLSPTYASLVLLLISFWACAPVASGDIDAFKRTVMAACRAFVQVLARVSVWIEHVSTRAGTNVAASSVPTCELAWQRYARALVFVNAVCSALVGLVTRVTDTPVRTQCIYAPAVFTRPRHCDTLVHIWGKNEQVDLLIVGPTVQAHHKNIAYKNNLIIRIIIPCPNSNAMSPI